MNPEQIIEIVCNKFNVSVEEVKSRKKHRHISECRQAAMCIIKKSTTFNLARIGDLFNRDHTSVIHALKVVDSLNQYDANFRKLFNECVQLCKKNYDQPESVFDNHYEQIY